MGEEGRFENGVSIVNFSEKMKVKLEGNDPYIKINIYGVHNTQEELVESFDLQMTTYFTKLFDQASHRFEIKSGSCLINFTLQWLYNMDKVKLAKLKRE